MNYQGERPYSTTMTPADRQAVASVYELAQLLSSITEIKKEMEEANLKIEFVKRKMQEREERDGTRKINKLKKPLKLKIVKTTFGNNIYNRKQK